MVLRAKVDGKLLCVCASVRWGCSSGFSLCVFFMHGVITVTQAYLCMCGRVHACTSLCVCEPPTPDSWHHVMRLHVWVSPRWCHLQPHPLGVGSEVCFCGRELISELYPWLMRYLDNLCSVKQLLQSFVALMALLVSAEFPKTIYSVFKYNL